MVFKLVMTAAKTWRRLKGEKLLPKVVEGITFKDGIKAVEHQPTSPPNRPSPKPAHSPCGIGDGA